MKEDECRKLDTLTNFFVYDNACIEIAKALQGGRKTDTVFLIRSGDWDQMKANYGEKNANLSLAKFSFLLTKVFHKTDIFVRVSADTFFIYNFGSMNTLDIKRTLQQLQVSIDHSDLLSKCMIIQHFHVGVYHVDEEKTFDELLRKTQSCLDVAKQTHSMLVVDDTTQIPNISRYPLAIPEYKLDSQDVDTLYITDMMNFLFDCSDLSFGIEMLLSRMCDYFQTQQIYVTEKDCFDEGYTITHDWYRQDVLLENDNFKKGPLSIGNRHKEVFDERGLLVCNQISDMFKHDVFMALRAKIRGAQSLLQSALYDNGEYIGYICMIDSKKERVWTAKEIATFSMLSNIVTTNILQLRAQRIHQLVTNRDPLTNAWNLNKFTSVMAQRQYFYQDQHKALITVDIKNFKFINSEYGYQYGNAILISIAQILHLFIESNECYARIDSDTFVLCLYYKDLDRLKQRITSLLKKLERCSISFENKARILCMAGIYLFERTDKTVAEMIDYANMARKSIKDSHKSSYAFFNNEIEAQNIKEHHLSQIMKQALQDEEFVVYYQPKINIKTHRCIGLEALIRWYRSENEIIQPNDFIPLFERNHFILELDLYVLKKVCIQIKSWIDQGLEPLPIAVNISRVHMEDSQIVHQIVNICDLLHVPRNLIELEITESAFLENEVVVIQKAMELKAAGFSLSMDDFGTGFSSLNLLKDLPVDSLKLDRAFFLKDSNYREKIILSNIINMAKQLNMEVISEGIETEKQINFLKEIGCEIAQGFYYSRPVPIKQLLPQLWNEFSGGNV